MKILLLQVWDWKSVSCAAHARESDMLYTSNEGMELVVSTYDGAGFGACDPFTKKRKWRIQGNLPEMEKQITAWSVTTDGKGRLFVCEGPTGNRCVQMFSVSDGEYIGPLIREGEEGLGTPCCIRWREQSSSLVVADVRDKTWFISEIYIQKNENDLEEKEEIVTKF